MNKDKSFCQINTATCTMEEKKSFQNFDSDINQKKASSIIKSKKGLTK